MKKTGRSKGLTLRDVVNHISAFKQQVNSRFDVMDQRFDAMDQRFDVMDQRFERADEKFEGIDRRFDRQDEDIDCILSILVKDRKTIDDHEPRIRKIERHLKFARA